MANFNDFLNKAEKSFSSGDISSLANSIAQGTGFSSNPPPSVSGWGTRQSRLANERPGQTTRNLMRWLVPEGPIVEMYVNPQNVVKAWKKVITPQRTKGGYTVQYWGEDLINISISGTTGTSGIEGINVLHDVYRNEQLAIDPFALFMAAKNTMATGEGIGSAIGGLIGGDTGSNIGAAIGIGLAGPSSIDGGGKPGPSLAELAFTVELFWSGEVYRGYFMDFRVTEDAKNLGMFDYSMTFIATQRRGFRQNFMPWHRSAVDGPSSSHPVYGRPYSFKQENNQGPGGKSAEDIAADEMKNALQKTGNQNPNQGIFGKVGI